MSGRRDTQGSACLFVGRLSKDTRAKDLEDVFYKYGKLIRCDVKYGSAMAYGFVEYDDPRDAQDAMRRENDQEVMGCRIVVEPSRPGGGGRGRGRDDRGYRGDQRYGGGSDRRYGGDDRRPGGRYEGDRYGGGGGYGGGRGGNRYEDSGRDRHEDRSRFERRRSPSPHYRRRSPSPPRGRRY